jgi:hypothetical protein
MGSRGSGSAMSGPNRSIDQRPRVDVRLFVIVAEDFAGLGIDQMNTRACQTRHGLKTIFIFGWIIGDPTLDRKPHNWAAIKKCRHAAALKRLAVKARALAEKRVGPCALLNEHTVTLYVLRTDSH